VITAKTANQDLLANPAHLDHQAHLATQDQKALLVAQERWHPDPLDPQDRRDHQAQEAHLAALANPEILAKTADLEPKDHPVTKVKTVDPATLANPAVLVPMVTKAHLAAARNVHLPVWLPAIRTTPIAANTIVFQMLLCALTLATSSPSPI